MFDIEFSASIAEDMADLRAFDRKQILDRIDVQLTHEPTKETRNKKQLVGLTPPWEHAGPVVVLMTPFDDDDLAWYTREHDPAFLDSLARARRQVERGETLGHGELKEVLGLD